MRGDVSEEVPADALDGIEFRLIEKQYRELLSGRAQGDEVRLDLLPRERINIMHAAVEHNCADHFLRRGVKDLAQRPQGDLGDDTLIDLSYLGDRPGGRGIAGSSSIARLSPLRRGRCCRPSLVAYVLGVALQGTSAVSR